MREHVVSLYGYRTGDVIHTGVIVISSSCVLSFGIVFVTPAQAKAAMKHGWQIIDGRSEDGELVRVERAVGFDSRR
jgi:hypothetical protein